ncbi:MAG: PIN domain-containing protein [Clostridiales bacterium]|jgi:tRNA(fMet)-specific endonuclease VapC|nr:PIN domain-containing protein [Clostridiales bacterium]
MMTYAFDTNTISYLLRKEGSIEMHYQDKIAEGRGLYAIPFIVLYEVRRWLDNRPTKQIREFTVKFEKLFSDVRGLAGMSEDIWLKASEIYIQLRQKGQLIGDADILIAAYCIVNDYTLVTRNEGDFGRIGGLKFINWYE